MSVVTADLVETAERARLRELCLCDSCPLSKHGLVSMRAALEAVADKLQGDLRRLLAQTYAGSNLYVDDGELQDSAAHPAIDFLRDSPAVIEAKIRNRAADKLQPATQGDVIDKLRKLRSQWAQRVLRQMPIDATDGVAELDELIASAEVTKPAAQGEAVAEIGLSDDGYKIGYLIPLRAHRLPIGTKLYTHPGEPVARIGS